MIKKIKHVRFAALLITCLAILFSAVSVNAQTRKELEKKRRRLEKQISATKKVLEETKEKKHQSLQTLEALSRQIRQREKLIGTVNTELNEISGEIDTKQQLINQLNNDLDSLKSQYARMIVRAYKARNNYDKVSFILASDDFNQALKRMGYMQRFGEARRKQLEKIAQTRNDINSNLVDLSKIRNEKETLLLTKEDEKKELEQDKSSENVVFKSLKTREAELRKELKNKQDDAAKLNRAIEKMIAKEIEAAKKRAERAAAAAAAKKKKSSKNKESPSEKTKKKEVIASPEEIKLSADFEKNKNSLPWPLEKGVVVSSFGVHKHPEMENITIVNNGIDISTNAGAVARSVFKGRVVAILNVTGSNTTVLVNHGEYYTVYSNLSEVFVTKGQEINIRQNIGKVYTDDEGKTRFHFEIWKQYTKLDPENWLYDR